MGKKPEPEDLGVKIGSKKEAFLTKVQNVMEEEIENNEMAIYFNKLVLPIIKKEIKVEKENFK